MVSFPFTHQHCFISAIRSKTGEDFFIKSKNGIYYNSESGFAEYILDDLIDRATYGNPALFIFMQSSKLLVGFANSKLVKEASFFELKIENNQTCEERIISIVNWYSKITSKTNTVYIHKRTRKHDKMIEKFKASIVNLTDADLKPFVKSSILSLSKTQKIMRFGVLVVFLLISLFCANRTDIYMKKYEENMSKGYFELTRKQKDIKREIRVLKSLNSESIQKIKNLAFKKYTRREFAIKGKKLLDDYSKEVPTTIVVYDGKLL